MLLIVVLSISLVLQSLPLVGGQGNGAVRLLDMATVSGHFGRVQIFFNMLWGSLCSDGFGSDEADVVCHQLGYANAASFSKASEDNYGSDGLPIQIGSVSCTGQELVLLQCSYQADISCPIGDAVSVTCNQMAIWNSPYAGQVRLMDGNFATDGRVEIYCNGQWGTVCNLFVDSNAANTLCIQLGYSAAQSYGNMTLPGSSADPIWYHSLTCLQAASCITTCQPCPEMQSSSCTHDNDLTIQCTYNRLTNEGSDITTCAVSTGLSAGAIAGIVVGVVAAVATVAGLAVAIPLVVWRCPGVCKLPKITSRRNEGNVAFTAKDNEEVVTTARYAFSLDHNLEPIEDELPPI